MEDSDILDIFCDFCDDELVLGSDDIGGIRGRIFPYIISVLTILTSN